MPLEAIVFDAYGTLFDVHSVSERCEQFWPGRGAAVSQLWRGKQLEYSWLRSLMRRYENFETITADALRHACAALQLRCDEAQLAQLMQAYRQLKTFPEVGAVLAACRGCKRAILSNGSPPMLDALVSASGLAGEFDAVISVDALGIYKPDARVYQLAVAALGVEAGRIAFVSANCWDACGAQSFGFDAWWINRGGAPADRLGVRPAHVVGSLAELPV